MRKEEIDKQRRKFSQAASNGYLKVLFETIGDSAYRWISLMGYHHSGKSTLVKWNMMRYCSINNSLPEEDWEFEPWKKSPYTDIPLFIIDVVSQSSDTMIDISEEYVDIDFLLNELIRTVRPGEETEELLRSLRESDVNYRYTKLRSLLSAEGNFSRRPVFVLQGTSKNQKFENLVYSLFQRVVTKETAVKPLVILEFWHQEEKNLPTASRPIAYDGGPPTKKPTEAVSKDPRSYIARSSEYKQIIIRGLSRPTAVAHLKEFFCTKIPDLPEDSLNLMSDAAHLFCGGHLGAMVIVMDAILSGIEVPEIVTSFIAATKEEEFISLIEKCIVDANRGEDLEKQALLIFQSTNWQHYLAPTDKWKDYIKYLETEKLVLDTGSGLRWIRLISQLLHLDPDPNKLLKEAARSTVRTVVFDLSDTELNELKVKLMFTFSSRNFNDTELRDLVTKLDIDWAQVDATSMGQIPQNLADYIVRHRGNKLAALAEKGPAYRPNIDWSFLSEYVIAAPGNSPGGLTT